MFTKNTPNSFKDTKVVDHGAHLPHALIWTFNFICNLTLVFDDLNLDAKTNEGKTALLLACEGGFKALALKLFHHGAKLTHEVELITLFGNGQIEDSKQLNTYDHDQSVYLWAAQRGRTDILSSPEDINTIILCSRFGDSEDPSRLNYQQWCDYINSQKNVTKRHSRLHDTNEKNQNALHIAVTHNQVECIPALTSYYLQSFNTSADHDGNLPIHLLVVIKLDEDKLFNLAMLLLDQMRDDIKVNILNHKNNDNCTVIELLRNIGYNDCANKLEDVYQEAFQSKGEAALTTLKNKHVDKLINTLTQLKETPCNEDTLDLKNPNLREKFELLSQLKDLVSSTSETLQRLETANVAAKPAPSSVSLLDWLYGSSSDDEDRQPADLSMFYSSSEEEEEALETISAEKIAKTTV